MHTAVVISASAMSVEMVRRRRANDKGLEFRGREATFISLWIWFRFTVRKGKGGRKDER
jgi:hypothetical protein